MNDCPDIREIYLANHAAAKRTRKLLPYTLNFQPNSIPNTLLLPVSCLRNRFPYDSTKLFQNFWSQSSPLDSSSAVPSSDPTTSNAQRAVDHSASGQPNINCIILFSDDSAALIDP